jgi:6-pyruvoyltetrahydropterin/6-carboxytetrahydropterin synthase
MFTIRKRFYFEAHHRLGHLPAGHKCNSDHGHSYELIVELMAPRLDERGFVVDFNDLTPVDELCSVLDHASLNDVMGGGEWTTSERMCVVIYAYLARVLDDLSAVTLSETRKTDATFRASPDVDVRPPWAIQRADRLALYVRGVLDARRDVAP